MLSLSQQADNGSVWENPNPSPWRNGKKPRKDKNKWKTGGVSHTIVNTKIRWKMIRVDVEYPTGGSTWNVHIQVKWLKGKFFLKSIKDLSKLPKSIKTNRLIQTWVEKAFRNLKNFKH